MNKTLVLTALPLPFPLMATSAFDGTWKIDVSKIHGSGTAQVMTLKDGLYTCNCAAPPHQGRRHRRYTKAATADAMT